MCFGAFLCLKTQQTRHLNTPFTRKRFPYLSYVQIHGAGRSADADSGQVCRKTNSRSAFRPLPQSPGTIPAGVGETGIFHCCITIIQSNKAEMSSLRGCLRFYFFKFSSMCRQCCPGSLFEQIRMCSCTYKGYDSYNIAFIID